jgi:hypothetical protein
MTSRKRHRRHPTGHQDQRTVAECFCGATTILGPDNIARLCGQCGNPMRKPFADNNTEGQETAT